MKKNNNETKQKFKFGRNPATILIIFGGLIILFLLFSIPYGYITEGNKNDITPFKTKFEEKDELALDGVKRMKGSDFKVLDIDFYCSNYDVEGNNAKFSINVTWNDNTSSLCDDVDKFNSISGTYTVDTYIGLCADWVGFENYSGSNKIKVAKDQTTQSPKTVSVRGINEFPKYANTWPIKVKVETPNAYLYLRFSYQLKGNTISRKYILEYSYNEYYVPGKTLGGIPA